MISWGTKRSVLIFIGAIVTVSAHAVVDTIQGSVGGVTNQVNRDVGDVPGNRYNGDLRFVYHNKDHPYEIERKLDFAGLVNDQSLFMYSLQEAFVGMKGVFKPWDSYSHSGDHLKVGRQILDWSPMDAQWGLGKVNNRRNFDFYDPGQEGLIGVGYENRSSGGFTWKVFGSGIYVPEMNPSLDINKKDRTIKSRHPWSNPPAETAEIQPGNKVPVEYVVNMPSVSDVIYRYSVGASVGWQNKHWLADGFFMRKPENQITPKATVSVPDSADRVKATVTPQFYYHDVFGGTGKYRNKDIEIYVSGVAVQPNTFPDGDSDVTGFTDIKTEKRREAYGGGGISKMNDTYGMGVGYIARLSPFDRERDSLAPDPRWNQAVNAFVMRNFGEATTVSADIKYDMLTTDRLFMLRAGYKASKELLLTFGVNMIGTPKNGKSFWSPYTNNDAVLAGLRYLF